MSPDLYVYMLLSAIHHKVSSFFPLCNNTLAMSLQQKDDSKYEFQMLKFWDFTNSIPQKRPDESWFRK